MSLIRLFAKHLLSGIIYTGFQMISIETSHLPRIFFQIFSITAESLFATIPMKLISDEDPIFSFIPVAALGELPPIGTGFQILQDTDVTSQQTRPVLRTNQRIINVSPLTYWGGYSAL